MHAKSKESAHSGKWLVFLLLRIMILQLALILVEVWVLLYYACRDVFSFCYAFSTRFWSVISNSQQSRLVFVNICMLRNSLTLKFCNLPKFLHTSLSFAVLYCLHVQSFCKCSSIFSKINSFIFQLDRDFKKKYPIR